MLSDVVIFCHFCKSRNIQPLVLVRLKKRFNRLDSSGLEYGPLSTIPTTLWYYLLGRRATELHVSPPGVEVGSIRLHVLGSRTCAMRVEDELVWREEETTERALNALGSRGVVSCGQEGPAAPPSTFVVY
jgi:hypothetical protein